MRYFLDIVDKLEEADFFLDAMKTQCDSFRAFRFHLSTYCSAARSVTWVLQAVGSQYDGFDAWYSEACATLQRDPVAKYLVLARNESEKEGHVPVGSSRTGDAMAGEANTLHFFDRLRRAAAPAPPTQDVVAVCQRHFQSLLAIVHEFGGTFSQAITKAQTDPDQVRRTLLELRERAGVDRFLERLLNQVVNSPEIVALLRGDPVKPLDPLLQKHGQLGTKIAGAQRKGLRSGPVQRFRGNASRG
jgi:hypothetical protein